MKNSPLIVAKSEEDNVLKTHGYSLVDRLVNWFNTPALSGDIPVDYTWVANGVVVMGDNKTPEDLMGSQQSGHLTNQIMDMKTGGLGFLLIEGDILGNGTTIGDDKHSWLLDRFDNFLATIQSQGIYVIHSPNAETTPRRLHYFYEWTSQGEHDGWLIPERVLPPASDYADEDFRWKVGMLMHLGGRKGKLGQKKAEDLLYAFGLMGALGITEEALSETHKKWIAVDGIGKVLADRWYKWLRN